MSLAERKSPSRVDWKHYAEWSSQSEIPYYLWGNELPLFMDVGTHGNEHRSILPFTKFVMDYYKRLNGFCFIPCASPTATGVRKMENKWNNNVNRICWQHSPDPEAILIQNIALRHGPFDVMVLVHEDNLPFYFYHQGKSDQFLHLEALRNAITKIDGIGFPYFHTGYDVPKEIDPLLGIWFKEGYAHLPHLPLDGTFEGWALNFGLAKTIYTIEIPMQLPRKVKYRLCEVFFENVILTNPALCK
jgi:hypothetical protein